MRISTGKVVDGKIIVEGESLQEGALVTVVAYDDSETFAVSDDQKQFLIESIAEIHRGDWVSAEEMMEQLHLVT